MKTLEHIFHQNREWANRMRSEDPSFFEHTSQQQSPKYLWIGCSDSRVPANQIMGLRPGEVFVHRNVANVVVHTDVNCLSVLQYAVEVLKVEHVILCGHYGCGGVLAAMTQNRTGAINSWLHHVEDVYTKFYDELNELDEPARHARLCELNVIEQVHNICRTGVVRNAWLNNQKLSIHGWIYALEDGLLRDLGVTCIDCDDADLMYRRATGQRA